MGTIIPGHLVALKCLGDHHDDRFLFLDGRTTDPVHPLGLAPNTNDFSGTRWIADAAPSGGLFLKCAGNLDGPRYLNGHTVEGTVDLVPTNVIGNGNLTGTRWTAIDNGGSSVALHCEGAIVNQQHQFLDGNTFGGTVGLAPTTNGGFTGTHWDVVDLGPLPTSITFDDNSIVFPTGTPVGGFTHLTLRQDGSYTFSGHFHDSGADEFNVGLVAAVKDLQNRAYTFQTSGHVAGTFEPGSRDFDWNISDRNDTIARNWSDLAIGAKFAREAQASPDFVNLTNSVIGALGLVVGVVAIVIA
jgi:hypothetical protein